MLPGISSNQPLPLMCHANTFTSGGVCVSMLAGSTRVQHFTSHQKSYRVNTHAWMNSHSQKGIKTSSYINHWGRSFTINGLKTRLNSVEHANPQHTWFRPVWCKGFWLISIWCELYVKFRLFCSENTLSTKMNRIRRWRCGALSLGDMGMMKGGERWELGGEVEGAQQGVSSCGKWETPVKKRVISE